MRAHLLEAAVEPPLLTSEDRVHRRLHVVVDAAPTGAAKKAEAPVVGVEHHLLGLARIRDHQEHPAIAKADVGDLDRGRHAAEHHDLVAPVELIRFPRSEPQRDEGRHRLAGRHLHIGPFPLPGMAPDRVIAARVAGLLQQIKHPGHRQPLTPAFAPVLLQKRIK